MIDLYYWTTPNGHKATLFLENRSSLFHQTRLPPANIRLPSRHGLLSLDCAARAPGPKSR
jgi:hypothetical protein